MAEEIILAVLAFLIACSFGWLGGVAIGTMLFGKAKLYSAKERDIAKSVWRSGPGANNHEA